MAVYFLEKSTTYQRQTNPAVYRRREVVAKHLQDNYKVAKFKDEEVYQTIKNELAAENIEINRSSFQADKVILRSAFLYLTGDKAKYLVNTASASARVGVNCLVKDGITRWNQLGYGGTQAGPSTEENREEAVTPKEDTKRFNLEDFQAGQSVKSSFNTLVVNLEDMLSENERLKQEILRQGQTIEVLKNRTADDQGYIELMESELSLAEQKVKDLKEIIRNAQTSAYASTLDQIATDNPDFPQLTVIAQQIRERRNGSGQNSNLLGKLPAEFAWPNSTGKIEYDNQFLKTLGNLAGEEQSQAIRQLETLATQGPEYASLHTRKNTIRLPFSPPDCLISRAADDIRFTWKKNGTITVYWLFRKGDSRVRTSEK